MSPQLGYVKKYAEVDGETFASISDLIEALNNGKSLEDVIAMVTPRLTVPPLLEVVEDVGTDRGSVPFAQVTMSVN